MIFSVMGSKLRKRPLPLHPANQQLIPSLDKNLGKIDHSIRRLSDPDPRQPEIAHDIPAMPRTMQPAIYHFPGAHRPRSDILRRHLKSPQLPADPVDPLPETVMAKRAFARQHIAAMAEC